MNLTLYAVGDIMLGEQPLCYRFGVGSIIRKKGIDYLFRHVANLFTGADIIIGNLETPASIISNKTGYYSAFFRAHPDSIEGLKRVGFNVLSIANNHIMEHGEEAFLETLNILEKNSILPLGTKNQHEYIHNYNYKIIFLCYSCIEDNVTPSFYNKISSIDGLTQQIRRLKNESDLIVVYLHWGDEYSPFPSRWQIESGRMIIDAGADLVIGSHPHVLQPFEIYKGRPIFYSLGNFIFDQSYISRTLDSAIAKIDIDIDSGTSQVFLIPIRSSRDEYYPVPEPDLQIMTEIENIRSHLENNSVDDYCAWVEGIDHKSMMFQSKARLDMKLQYLKNLHRYPIGLSFTILRQYFMSRLTHEH